MTIEDLKAAIERRGYVFRLYPPREGRASVTFAVYRDNGPITLETPGIIRSLALHDVALTHLRVGELAEEILAPFCGNQHHMACGCGEPVLITSVMRTYPVLEPLSCVLWPSEQAPESSPLIKRSVEEYVYRSAKAGPDSALLTSCPRCHQALSAEQLKDFDDKESEQEMTEQREIHPEAARGKALEWLEIRLEDEGALEEFWDNYQDMLEEPPELAVILATSPQILAALKAGQPLPAMDSDVRDAFAQYLEDYDDDIAASELANTDEDRDAWTDAVMHAWVALRQPLQSAQ